MQIIKKIISLVLIITLSGCVKNSDGTTTIIPLAPTNLSVTVVSPTEVNLFWSDNSTDEIGYKIERKTANGNYLNIGSVAANVSSFKDNTLTAFLTYTYRVYAYNSAGNSINYSNEVTITTNGVALVTTNPISQITNNSALGSGTITNTGGTNISSRGVVWSTTPSPTILLSTKTNDGTGAGTFTSNIINLTPSTTYYVRAYATNSSGTAYGNEISLKSDSFNIKKGLIVWYPFTNNTVDSSGNGNDAIVNGASLSADRFGKSNCAYTFPSVCSNTNTIQSTINTSSIANSFTMSLWLEKLTTQCSNKNGYLLLQPAYPSLSGTNNSIDTMSLGWYGGTLGQNYLFKYSEVLKYNFSPFSNYNFPVFTLFQDKPLNIWTNIVVIFDSNNISLYQDGILINSKPRLSNLTFLSNVSLLTIGYGEWKTPSGGWSIDDFRIYNRALSPQEVQYLYTH